MSDHEDERIMTNPETQTAKVHKVNTTEVFCCLINDTHTHTLLSHFSESTNTKVQQHKNAASVIHKKTFISLSCSSWRTCYKKKKQNQIYSQVGSHIQGIWAGVIGTWKQTRNHFYKKLNGVEFRIIGGKNRDKKLEYIFKMLDKMVISSKSKIQEQNYAQRNRME